jgi:hypothetical protein
MLDRKHSADLYTALLLNHKEILRSVNPQTCHYYCLDERDREFVPGELPFDHLIFYPHSEINATPGILTEKYFPLHTINLIICSNTIGISNNEIRKIFDIINTEDEAIVIGRSKKERTAFIGLNYENPHLLEDLKWDRPNFDFILSKACMFSNKVNILDDYMLINTVEDFKNLYLQLSKKESLTYCSQGMHERFTNIFIEYKELLK